MQYLNMEDTYWVQNHQSTHRLNDIRLKPNFKCYSENVANTNIWIEAAYISVQSFITIWPFSCLKIPDNSGYLRLSTQCYFVGMKTPSWETKPFHLRQL